MKYVLFVCSLARSLAHSFTLLLPVTLSWSQANEFFLCMQASKPARIYVCMRMYTPYTDVYRIFNTVRVDMCMCPIRYVFRVQLCVFHNNDFELHFYELKIIQFRIHTNRANI